METEKAGMSSAAEKAEAVRVQRLREDAQRPISVNLAEGIALSHKLMQFAGAARKPKSESHQVDNDSAIPPSEP
jgi:hypothetical protein